MDFTNPSPGKSCILQLQDLQENCKKGDLQIFNSGILHNYQQTDTKKKINNQLGGS